MALLPRGRNAGFSLFEMMVVLFILAILAAMSAPSLGRVMDAVAFKRKVAAVTAAMRYGRLRAVASGVAVRMSLSRDDGCFFILKGAKTERRRCYFDDRDEVLFEPAADIRFLVDGRTRPVTITIRSGVRTRLIRVDILTGRPLVVEGMS